MKCQEVSAVLEEYFDGELAAERQESVAAHLATCAVCTHAYEELQRTEEFLLRYERDIEVTPALWHGVQARIANAQTEPQLAVMPLGRRLRTWLAATFTVPRFSPALTAALVIVAIALTVGVMKLTTKHENTSMANIQTPTPVPSATRSQPEPPPAPVPSVSPAVPEQQRAPQFTPVNSPEQRLTAQAKKRDESPERNLLPDGSGRTLRANATVPTAPHEPTAEDLVKDAEAKYQKAIEILNRDVNKRRSTIDPDTLARYDDTLKALDRTIAETRRAALGQGNDPVAVQYMLTAYAKKVEVLREMAR